MKYNKSEKMTNKQLIEYLEQFSEDSEVSVVIVNSEKRLHHIVSRCDLLIGEDYPAIILETLSDEPLDD